MGSTFRTIEWVGDIGGYRETYILQTTYITPVALWGKGIDEGTEHPAAIVTRSTAAKTNNDVTGTLTDGIGNELAGAVGRCQQRIALIGREQRQAAGPSHLDDGRIAAKQIAGFDRTHQGVADRNPLQYTSHCRLVSLKPSLAAIAHRQLYDGGIGANSPDTFCCRTIGFGRSETTLE